MQAQTNKSKLVQMIPATRKRVYLGLCVFLIIFLILRHLINKSNVLIPNQIQQRSPGTPVIVTVYYEALCSDSKHFLMKQVLPAYKTAAPLMDIQLVPYGKAQTFVEADGTYRFDCQHGPLECQANKYHSCAIEAIEDVAMRLNIIVCMIRDNRLPKEAMHRCAKQYNFDNIDLIQKCYDSSHGAELMKLNGDATNALRPSVRFIPTITLDGSQGRQALILKDLLSEVCKVIGDTPESHKICKDFAA